MTSSAGLVHWVAVVIPVVDEFADFDHQGKAVAVDGLAFDDQNRTSARFSRAPGVGVK
jgi:hypothetical protein